jgi:hypothetical protein
VGGRRLPDDPALAINDVATLTAARTPIQNYKDKLSLSEFFFY